MFENQKKVLESKVSITGLTNHTVHVWSHPRESRIVNDFTGQLETFMATREFMYHGSIVCVANDENKTFRLSHAGVFAHKYEKVKGVRVDTGIVLEGVFPKTTTQRLMSYRDWFTTLGYTEIEPIDGRAGRDWREWDKAYKESKVNGVSLKPRKAPKIKGISREIEFLLESKGINVRAIIEEATVDKHEAEETLKKEREMAVMFEQAEFDKLMIDQQLDEQSRWEVEEFYKPVKEKTEKKSHLFQKQPYSRSHKPVAKCRSMVVAA